MKAAERYNLIEQIINKEGTASFATLKKSFPNISDMTLRRDLEYLDREKRLIRVHGGARSVQATVGAEESYRSRNALHMERKKAIAEKAAVLLRPNTAIFIDSGTTTTELCRHIPQEHYLIYTSGITCALELKRLEKAEIFMVGGRLNTSSLSTNGSDAIAYIENLHFNLAILGSTGFDIKYGFTCENNDDARLKRDAIKHADRSIVLMDSSKQGRVSTYVFASVDEIETVVTDDNLDDDYVKHFIGKGIHVV